MEVVSCKRKLSHSRNKGEIRRNRIDDLPDELLIKILLRLPMLSAHRSKLVCKRWYALLSSPFFDECFARKPKIFSILLRNKSALDEDVPFFSTGSNQFTEFKSIKGLSLGFVSRLSTCPPKLLASCNDLQFCWLRHGVRRRSFVVCNPITEERVELPPPPAHPASRHQLNGLLCYSNGSYAIVRIPFPNCYSYMYNISIIELQIFSSDTFEWSQKKTVCPIRVHRLVESPSGATRYKGLLFWLFLGEKRSMDGLIGIDPFDLCKTPYTIDMPRGFSSPRSYYRNNMTLSISAGRLRLFQISVQCNAACEFDVSVWDLNLHENKDNHCCYEWILYHEGTFKDNTFAHSPRGPRPQVLACQPDNSIIVYILSNKQVLSYNLLEQNWTVVCESPSLKEFYAYTFLLPWQPTRLLSPVSNRNG